MIGHSSANIYLSATKEDYQDLDPEQAQHYRRPQKIWLISVEPHKHSIPFVPRHQHEATHFVATKRDDESSYSVKEHPKDGIIGAILLAEATHCSSEDIRQKLQDGLQTSTGSSLPSEILEDGESDHWIRRAIHVLQDYGLVERFDVGEFMTFAHSYAANRMEGDGPLSVAYPGLHKRKERKRGFWLSYPMQARRRECDEESRLYGGLM
ncbi:hypothetical protein KC318_g3203 [Hortaea werneckii]|nr:hypothetical protein KC355_g3761 [Hortaea werneckii]KAI7185191.1 hypothetical protein KC324_g7489 [Hortaea werneckii]KAI7590373.1 hypothetical protein KC316_g3415 [Hortaea werneckii]KAI7671884.1 hypothetical protein KC318_g3203 [Hortaea werneckii]